MAVRQQVVCGWHAVLAALEQRPRQLRRLYLHKERSAELAETMRQLAKARVPYHIVAAEDLERLCASRAHQGVAAVFDPPVLPRLSVDTVGPLAQQAAVWLALDGVGNPHNLGAIARTAAFLGVRGLWLDARDAAPITSTAALRTAEGALEHLSIQVVEDLPAALAAFGQAGGATAALCLDRAVSWSQWQPQRDRGVVVVAGAEETGVRPAVRAACQTAVRIDGTAAVESLNVGVAVGIVLARLLASGGRS
ncbi:MAG: RNA methyltransferase [Deltaproteobacteria bacterium]|nr:RNA methyltransferase [Deltaproteobacteria bacterium]